MKALVYLSIIFSVISLSCKRNQDYVPDYLATVNLVNAIPSYDAKVKVHFNDKFPNYSSASEYFYGDYEKTRFSVLEGKVSLKIVLSSDTLHSIYDRTVNFNKGDIYSLFLSGSPEEVDTLLFKENIPIQKDSVAGIRFVNLCKNSGDLSVNLEGEAIGSELKDLSYQEVSSFLTYSARSKNISYVFEIRNQIGERIGRFEFNNTFNDTYTRIPRFRNTTILLRGIVNAFPGFEAIRIDNY